MADTSEDPGLIVPEAHPRVPPIDSRFLFVDVASLRAKQLRRGARPRLDADNDDTEQGLPRTQMFKPERIAMEEVRRGLVPYDIGHSR